MRFKALKDIDIIIFDLVDNFPKDTFRPQKENQQARKVEKKSIGILYHGKQGERLINVAFSRAKSKLFIVGEKNTLSHSNLSIFVSIKVTNIMQKIENNSVQTV